jgi:hypothetical protein
LFTVYFSSFHPVDAKNFQSKFKRAEEAATKMLLPGTHSTNDGEGGEDVPESVSIFQQYWEHKKSHPSKSMQEEQKREERCTMQHTILAPVPLLGSNINELVSEISTSKSRQPSTNSLIVEGGSMRVVPTVQSTATKPRPITGRRVSTSSQSLRNSNGQTATSSCCSSDNRLSEMMEMMEPSSWKLYQKSFGKKE